MNLNPKKVFISYSHDSLLHKERVLALADRLREDGINCNIDQYEMAPPKRWPHWMLDEIESADFVLVVCTEQYNRRFRANEAYGRGKGATWEGGVIMQELYDAQGKNSKFVPIVFTLAALNFVPNPLSGVPNYRLQDDDGYELLYRRMTIIPALQTIPSQFKTAFIKVRKFSNPHRQEIVISHYPKQDWQHVETLDTVTKLELVRIPAGRFKMGAPEDGSQLHIAHPIHNVDVPEFYIGKYPITQQQWKFGANLPKINRELNPDPSNYDGENLPVESVSWFDAIEFCSRLSHYTGREYRLPSEAEWEYACRSGTETPFHFGETIDTQISNYNGNIIYRLGQKGSCRQQTTSVDTFEGANVWGLYDMHGNVREWCQDFWHDNYQNAPIDGSAWIITESLERVLRGGSFIDEPNNCRSAARSYEKASINGSHIGFRLAVSVQTLVAPTVRLNYGDEVAEKVMKTKIEDTTTVPNNDGNSQASVAQIRQLVEDALSDDDLNNLCQDEFPKVFKQFTTGQTKSQRIRLLVEYVERQREIPKLLNTIEEINPNVHTEFMNNPD